MVSEPDWLRRLLVQPMIVMSVLGALFTVGCSVTPVIGEGDEPTAESGVVAQWDYEQIGTIPIGSRSPASVAANVVASDFTSSDGSPTTTVSQGVFWLTEDGWMNEGSYLSCSITAAEGYEVRLQSVKFEQATLHESGPTTWQARSSADGFTADLATGDVVVFPTLGSHTAQLTGITVGQSGTEFRWLATGATGPNVLWGLDNVVFRGEVVAVSN